MSVITETGEEVIRSVNSLLRRRPPNKTNSADYQTLAFRLEREAQEIRRRNQIAGERRSFQD